MWWWSPGHRSTFSRCAASPQYYYTYVPHVALPRPREPSIALTARVRGARGDAGLCDCLMQVIEEVYDAATTYYKDNSPHKIAKAIARVGNSC